MNVPLIGAVLAVVIWLMTAGLMIRKSWRIGYLEGQLAAWEERWREHQSLFHGPLSSGPTSMVSPLRSFNVASHADVFGGMGASGPAHPHPPGAGLHRLEEWARRDRNR